MNWNVRVLFEFLDSNLPFIVLDLVILVVHVEDESIQNVVKLEMVNALAAREVQRQPQ